jgi:uncharacterized protein (TIGR02145 family)
MKKLLYYPSLILFLYGALAFDYYQLQSPPNEIKIGDQIWMGENLNVQRFSNGDIIKEAKTDQEWINYCLAEKPAWCYYNNDPKNGLKLGKLYNAYALLDKRGLAPKGWHIPTHDEWGQLEKFLGKESAGEKLKSKTGWKKGLCSNSTGFSALPGGFRYGEGNFMQLNVDCYYWALPEGESDIKYKNSNMRYLTEDNSELTWGRIDWGVGYSVRCIKN